MVRLLAGTGADAAQWNHIDQYAKSTIVEKKIRVVYLSSDQAPSTPNAKALNGSVDDSDHALAATPAWSSSAATNGESPPRYSEHDDATPPEQPEPSVIPSASTIKSAVANVIPISTEDLQAQLTEAKATISRLVQQADQGLRQRKGASDIQEGSSAGLKTTTLSPSQTTPIGVPVQIVAGLCLLSFLLAYFLF